MRDAVLDGPIQPSTVSPGLAAGDDFQRLQVQGFRFNRAVHYTDALVGLAHVALACGSQWLTSSQTHRSEPSLNYQDDGPINMTSNEAVALVRHTPLRLRRS